VVEFGIGKSEQPIETQTGEVGDAECAYAERREIIPRASERLKKITARDSGIPQQEQMRIAAAQDALDTWPETRFYPWRFIRNN
jgi:hypothetical protein